MSESPESHQSLTPASPAPETGPGLPPGLRSAWLGPLVGYAATLVTGIVMMGLGLLAAVGLGDGGDPDAVTSDATEVLDGVLAILGAPFQLAAMALGGNLHVAEDGFGFSLIALPLLMTTVYVVAVFWFAARNERRTPSRSHSERVLISSLTAVAATVVVSLLTRLLAIRSDGASLHAMSLSLVVGTLLLTFVPDLLGRLRATTALPQAARPWSAAVATWVGHLAIWSALLLPLLVLWTFIEHGWRTALTLPLWAPTVLLWGYGLGHGSSVSLAGESMWAWSDNTLTAIGLFLVTAVATVLTSVLWHLRSRRSVATLQQPQSWATLPVAFAAGGLVVCLVGTVWAGGTLMGYGGSTSVGPALWTPLILGVWGLVVDLLARTWAPRLVPVVPARARALMAGSEPEGTVTAPPAPMTPEQAARTKRILLVVGGAVAALVVAVIGVSVVNSVFFGPERAAQAYLDALADGDAEQALDLAPPEGEETTAMLSNEVYEAARERPTEYELGEEESYGDLLEYSVSAEDGVGGEASLTLTRDGKTFGLFDRWEVVQGLQSSVYLPLPEGTESVEVNGVDVAVSPDSSYGGLLVLPGTYSIDPYAGNEWVEATPAESSVELGGSGGDFEFGEVQPSEKFKESVDTALDGWLATCMASSEPEPENCPQSAYVYDDYRDLTWELTQEPTVDYDYFSPEFPMQLSVDGGEATANYEQDESYGFGAPEWRQTAEVSSLYFNVTVDEQDGELVVTPEAY